MVRFIAFLFALTTLGRAGEFIVETNVVYGTAGETQLELEVVRPSIALKKSRAAIIVIHGGGWSQGSRVDMRKITGPLAQAGFVTFNVDYRLATDRGKNIWPAQLDDVQRAVRWVRANAAHYNADPQRLGAIGGSAGGHLATFLGVADTRDNSDVELSKFSSRVQCVVDAFGPQDLADTNMWKQGLGYIEILVGDKPWNKRDLVRDASPIWHVDAKSSPFLIFHGAKDELVPPEQSKRLDAALREAGAESRLIILKDEGHSFGSPESSTRFLAETIAFFHKHLDQ